MYRNISYDRPVYAGSLDNPRMAYNVNHNIPRMPPPNSWENRSGVIIPPIRVRVNGKELICKIGVTPRWTALTVDCDYK